MPTIQRRFAAVTPGTVIDNVLAGSQYEFAPFDGTIEVAVITTAASGECSVFSGPDVLAEPGTAVPIKAAENLAYPDDYWLEDEVAQGDRLKVQLRNANAGGGANMNFIVSLRITPA